MYLHRREHGILARDVGCHGSNVRYVDRVSVAIEGVKNATARSLARMHKTDKISLGFA